MVSVFFILGLQAEAVITGSKRQLQSRQAKPCLNSVRNLNINKKLSVLLLPTAGGQTPGTLEGAFCTFKAAIYAGGIVNFRPSGGFGAQTSNFAVYKTSHAAQRIMVIGAGAYRAVRPHRIPVFPNAACALFHLIKPGGTFLAEQKLPCKILISPVIKHVKKMGC